MLWVADGLDVWERRLLDRLSQRVEVTPYTIGNVLADGWEDSPDHIGDGTLFHRLLELSDPNMPRPLLRRWRTGTSMRTTFFALTELGEAVTDGDQNRLDVVGLDRWIGGVHLDSTSGEVWCRDGSTLTRESFPNAPSHAARPTLSPMAAPESYPTDEVHLVEALRRIDENDRRTFYEMAAVAETLADPALDQPLLSRTDVETTCLPSAFEFTDFGRRVLAGEANHVRANGIDRWIGGMRLSTADGQAWWSSRGGIQAGHSDA